MPNYTTRVRLVYGLLWIRKIRTGERIMEEKKIWSMDDLVALTDEVQIDEVVFRGGVVEFQYC